MCLHRKEQIEVELADFSLTQSVFFSVVCVQYAYVYFHMFTDPYWPAGPGEGHVEGLKGVAVTNKVQQSIVSWLNLTAVCCRGTQNTDYYPETNEGGMKHILSELAQTKRILCF